MSGDAISVDGIDLTQYVRTVGFPTLHVSSSNSLEVTFEGEWSATMTPQQVMQVLAPEWAEVEEGDVVRLKYLSEMIEARVDKIAFDSEGNVFYNFMPLRPVV